MQLQVSAKGDVALDRPGETGLSVRPAPNAAFGNALYQIAQGKRKTFFIAQGGCFSPASLSLWFISVTKH